MYFFYFLGAAIEEGSLKPGDRLLEVNDVCVDGMSQSDVVALLRNVPLESIVNLVISRHSMESMDTPVAGPAIEATCSFTAEVSLILFIRLYFGVLG